MTNSPLKYHGTIWNRANHPEDPSGTLLTSLEQVEDAPKVEMTDEEDEREDDVSLETLHPLTRQAFWSCTPSPASFFPVLQVDDQHPMIASISLLLMSEGERQEHLRDCINVFHARSHPSRKIDGFVKKRSTPKRFKKHLRRMESLNNHSNKQPESIAEPVKGADMLNGTMSATLPMRPSDGYTGSDNISTTYEAFEPLIDGMKKDPVIIEDPDRFPIFPVDPFVESIMPSGYITNRHSSSPTPAACDSSHPGEQIGIQESAPIQPKIPRYRGPTILRRTSGPKRKSPERSTQTHAVAPSKRTGKKARSKCPPATNGKGMTKASSLPDMDSSSSSSDSDLSAIMMNGEPERATAFGTVNPPLRHHDHAEVAKFCVEELSRLERLRKEFDLPSS